MRGWPQLAHETTFALMDEVEKLDPDSPVLLRARIIFDVANALGIKPSGRHPNAGGETRREALARKIAERDASDADVKRLYLSGLSLLETGRRMGGHSSQWVTASLGRTGTPTRPAGNTHNLPDPARIARIRAMRVAGKTLEQIGAVEHISRERVRQICNHAGIDTSLSDELDAEQLAAVDDYMRGSSLNVVSVKYGVGITAIRNWVIRAGHVPRRETRRLTTTTKQRAERAAQLYKAGEKTAAIAATLGYEKPETIYRLLAIAGVKPNRKAGAGRHGLR